MNEHMGEVTIAPYDEGLASPNARRVIFSIGTEGEALSFAGQIGMAIFKALADFGRPVLVTLDGGELEPDEPGIQPFNPDDTTEAILP